MKPPRSASLRLGAAIFAIAALWLTIPQIANGWGADGHRYIAALAVNDLPASPLKQMYVTNLAWLEDNSSFPDRWLGRNDQSEPARHFLHPESYGVGASVIRVPREYADAVKRQNYSELREDGVLPWTIARHYKLLIAAWSAGAWDDVLFESAMLSSYVADAHVPFHATSLTSSMLFEPSQANIDQRFETTLLQRSIRLSDVSLPGRAAAIRDPREKSLEILQGSANYVPALLDADRKASLASGGVYDDTYWDTFTPIARPIAIERLHTAGETLAGMLQSAWVEAGQPIPPADFLMTDRYMPYAPPLVPDGSPLPPAMPFVSGDTKEDARYRVHPITVDSKILGRAVGVNVLLPADYATTRRRYPILYLLHGSSGSERDWNNQSGIAAYVENLEMIVVMPDGANSWYIDSPGQGKYESFFTLELMPTIDRSFRTIAQRPARAIAGNSMGGYGAWRIALDHPDLFGAAASLSGALDMGAANPHEGEPHDWITALYGETDAKNLHLYSADSLYPRIDALNRRMNWRGPALYFDAGGEDYLLEGDRHMEQYLLEKQVPYEFAEFEPGEHGWLYWDTHIRDALQFILRHLAPPTAY